MAVDLPPDGHLVSVGGFNDTNLTIMFRWRIPSLAALQGSANVFFIGTGSSGSISMGRNFNSSTFHLHVFSAALAFQGSLGNFTPTEGVWHAHVGRVAGTAVSRWHNTEQTGPTTFASIGKTGDQNLYLNTDSFFGNHQGDFDFADVVLLHAALTDEEILAYVNGHSGAFWARRAMSYWPMVVWDGSPVRDLRGYRDLTLTAGTAVKTDHPRMISPAEAA